MNRVVPPIFTAVVLFSSFNSNGQNHFTISYATKTMLEDRSRNVFTYPSLRMVIRDSLSYTYYPELVGNRKKRPLGSRYIPKSSFSNAAACLCIFPTGQVEKSNSRRLVIDSCKKGNWTISEETQVIAGYGCKKATGYLNGNSITVWFAPNLPANFAPFFLHDLPGTVLEYWYENGMTYTTAVEIKKGGKEIVEPTYYKRISRSEYDQNRKSR
jgi:GLPGLI family protein